MIDRLLSVALLREPSIINYSPEYNSDTANNSNCVIHISSPNSTNGATYNTIKNCIIRGLSNKGTEYVIAQGGSDAGGDPGSGALSPNSNNTYQNNEISAGNFGIFLNGSGTNTDQNTVVTGNSIGSSITARQLYYAGVWSQGEVGMQITNNSISGIAGSLTGSYEIGRAS